MAIYALSSENTEFPDVKQALEDPNGLLALGGDLSAKRLICAYRQGIFPWFSEGDPILWWSPDPRTILNLDAVRINRSLAKFLKKRPYRTTLNQAFDQVIQLCARAPYRQDGIWILPEMESAYSQLHRAGFAHSIEVWQGDQLVGGLYGVAINGYFSGESMVHLAPNASKLALMQLKQLLQNAGVTFIDCQLQNPFLAAMGSEKISRNRFITLKNEAIAQKLPDNFWLPRELPII